LQLLQTFPVFYCQCTGDRQSNVKSRRYRNETIGCTERTLIVSFVILLFVLRTASVSALNILFEIISYESAAKWDSCQIFKDDVLLVRV